MAVLISSNPSAVFGMCENLADIHDMPLKFDGRDQTVSVSGDVEYDNVADQVSVWKLAADRRQILPSRPGVGGDLLSYSLVPSFVTLLSAWLTMVLAGRKPQRSSPGVCSGIAVPHSFKSPAKNGTIISVVAQACS